MKKIVFTLVCLAVAMTGISQEKEKKEKDTTRVSLKNMEIIILTDNDSETDASGNTIKLEKKPKLAKDFNYWSGIDFGINGYFTDNNFGINSDPSNIHMELNYGRSFNMNLNLWEYTDNLIGKKFLFTTGLGFRFNRYAFKNTNTTLSFDDFNTFPVLDTVKRFDKNFLNATYISAPLMLTFVPGKNAKKSFHISTGIIANARIGSRVKQRYLLNDQKFKDISRGHYHLNPFLFDATVRAGVGGFTVYGTYSLNGMFEKGKGPQYTPFSIGISQRF
jgi:hypothetical protein